MSFSEDDVIRFEFSVITEKIRAGDIAVFEILNNSDVIIYVDPAEIFGRQYKSNQPFNSSFTLVFNKLVSNEYNVSFPIVKINPGEIEEVKFEPDMKYASLGEIEVIIAIREYSSENDENRFEIAKVIIEVMP